MSSASVSLEQPARQKRKATLPWRFRQNKLAVGGAVIVAIVIFVAVFANVVAPTGYN